MNKDRLVRHNALFKKQQVSGSVDAGSAGFIVTSKDGNEHIFLHLLQWIQSNITEEGMIRVEFLNHWSVATYGKGSINGEKDIEPLLLKTVGSTTASGGYGTMDYTVHLLNGGIK